MRPPVTAVEVVPPHTLLLTFADGTTGTVDLGPWLHEENPGVFEPLRDPARFAEVRVDHEAGTVVWPNGADLDPDVLYDEVTGRLAGGRS